MADPPEHSGPSDQNGAGETWYRKILDGLADRVVRFRVDDRAILYCNRPWAVAQGGTPEEMEGRRLDDVVSAPELEAVHRELELLLRGEHEPFNEHVRIDADGNPRIDQWTDQLVAGPDGRPEVISVGRDITSRVEAEKAARVSEERYRHLIERLPVPTVVTNADTILLANEAAASVLHKPSAHDMIGMRPELIFVADQQAVAKQLLADVLAGQPMPESARGNIETPDGVRTVEARSCRLVFDGQPAVLSVLHDVTEQQAAAVALEQSEAEFRLLTEHASDLVVRVDVEGRLLYVSPSSNDLVGIAPAELIGRIYFDLVHRDDLVLLDQLRERYLRGEWYGSQRTEFRLRTEHAGYRWFEASWSEMQTEEGELPHFHVMARDVDDRKKMEAALEHLAWHDPMTGLGNRALAVVELAALLRDERQHGRAVLLYIDLDRFKPINDAFGHAAGDVVLKEIARRLERTARSGDTVARVGGDEFVVIARRMLRPEETSRLVDRLRAAVEAPVPLDDDIVSVGCSIGAALVDSNSTVDQVLFAADVAMYADKKVHRG